MRFDILLHGYVPRALKKKVAKSHHSNKKDLLLCLNDLSMCDDDDPGSSADWIRAVDRGRLIHINNMSSFYGAVYSKMF